MYIEKQEPKEKEIDIGSANESPNILGQPQTLSLGERLRWILKESVSSQPPA